MNAFKLVFAICLGFLSSCNTKQELNAIDKSIPKDSLVPLQRTVIADLPDSLQPKTYFLKDMPKPVVRAVPKGGGETIMLPILKNEKGEPILDQEGKTILMGDGGISDFTNFTTEDGLALDGLDQGTVTAPSAGRGDRLTVCHFIYGIAGLHNEAWDL